MRWERRIFCFLLFEDILISFEYVGYVFFREECIFSDGEVGLFPFVARSRQYMPCNTQNDFAPLLGEPIPN
jgi:hypothetical protein